MVVVVVGRGVPHIVDLNSTLVLYILDQRPRLDMYVASS